jgi:hypothetical protein
MLICIGKNITEEISKVVPLKITFEPTSELETKALEFNFREESITRLKRKEN